MAVRLLTHPHENFRPAVFLDRDDTLNVNHDLPDAAFPGVRGDLFLPGHVRLLPTVRETCQRLHEAGFALVVVSNQACVARGAASIRDVEATNDRLRELLTHDGRSLIEAIYACPYHPEAEVEHLRDGHPWRKPGPGMLLAAASELGLDLSRSWLVGDAPRDIEAGIGAGLAPERCLRVGPDGGFATLGEAGERILAGAGACAAPGRSTTPSDESSKPVGAVPTPATTVTIRARDARPLADEETRATVVSAAHAIAERTGVRLIELAADEQSVTATLATHRLAALGFMAELRRATNAWYQHRYTGDVLWTQNGPPNTDENG